MSFADEIKDFVEKAKGNGHQVVRKTVIDVSTSLVRRSPVGNPALWVSLGASYRFMNLAGTRRLKRPKLQFRRQPPPGYAGGHFRANWQLGIGSLRLGEVKGRDKSGSSTLKKIVATIPNEAAGKVYYVANNTPYSETLEDGHSTQAPYGMVALTEAEFQEYIRENVAEVNK